MDSSVRSVMLAVRAGVIWAASASDGIIDASSNCLVFEARVMVTPASASASETLAVVGTVRQVVSVSVSLVALGGQIAPVCTLGSTFLGGSMLAKADSGIPGLVVVGWLRVALLGWEVITSVPVEFIALGARGAHHVATVACAAGRACARACVKSSACWKEVDGISLVKTNRCVFGHLFRLGRWSPTSC